MSGLKSKREDSEAKTKWGIFRRRKSVQDEINEFIIGDLNSKDEVILGPNGAIAGNVSARSIRIKGTIFGSVTAPEIIIDQSGQVWGDIFASALMITVNAKVHGWISTFDVGTLELIQSGTLSASDVMSIHLSAQSDELVKLRQSADKEGKIGNLANQPELYRKLQVEGGSAIIARLELERAFLQGNFKNKFEGEHSKELEGRNPVDAIEEPLSEETDIIILQEELSRTLKNLNDANAELARLSAKLISSVEKIEQLKVDRDLHKNRFRKLASWVYENQRAALN
ncbi:MAG: hypothetical protein BMS9Abin02_0957 [Anaerolineae bacterium]|nr:MAG: hypothetical protein BMS9Abin02_0957 [Anaerolineae bacterium]